jgi:predicted dienelactone hydrolase
MCTCGQVGRSLLGSIAAIGLTALPSGAADRISTFFGPLQFSLSIESLEQFAANGKVTDELAIYARQISPEQFTQFRAMLQQRLPVDAVLVSQVTYSRLGVAVLRQLGEVVQTGPAQNGFYALRAALILAAADREGLTLLNLVRQFPAESLRIDLAQALKLSQTLTEPSQTQKTMLAVVRQQAAIDLAQTPVDVSQLPDLQQPGPEPWRKQGLMVQAREGDRSFPVDLYLPQTSSQQSIPLIVILHGLAEDRISFDYLAKHLASYGFAVALPENPDNSSQRFRQFFRGQAPEPDARAILHQPQDVTRLLNELHQRVQTDRELARLNFQRVGVVGHSQGGLSALLLAGAPIDINQLRQVCQPSQGINFARLSQCQLLEFQPEGAKLRDRRIAAILPISPFVGSLLSRDSVNQIPVPVMMVAAENDLVTPPGSEQIRPFSWLTTPDRHLLLIDNATHLSPLTEGSFSFVDIPVPASWVGPEPQRVRAYLRAFSVAFFQTHLANQAAYRSYLSAAYAQALGQTPLNLSLVRSVALPASQR